ncbi:MAG: tryptophan--tRNA ligase [Candidatus Diapherotrites archaeon]|uniref:Tryptophan--tRNA ligase n=1 Tax=Candidatus Iainarchaeum sp. TaxID=3101447 RepID=A0A8T5GDC2_9ARCH|nr:tryptophan--tRNA ligase [Candidatus Diapherotrites archaeon]
MSKMVKKKKTDKQSVNVDPWGKSLVQDYSRLIKEFGMQPFDIEIMPSPSIQMKRGIIFGGQDLSVIAEAMKKKKPFYCLTGIMPSSEKIHLGTAGVVDNVRYFQENGATTYVLIADVESQATRGVPIEEGKKRALEFHIPAYIALGLDPKKTKFYFQSENKKVSNLASVCSQKITENEFRSIYGSVHPAKVMSAFIQMGDILHPQLDEAMPGVIPVGIDQAPHIRMSRDIARRLRSEYGFFAPAASYNKYTSALDGNFKMSKNESVGKIEIPENDRVALEKKLKKALTGGRVTKEEQKEKGGEPEKCVAYEYCKNHFILDDKVLAEMYQDCLAGKNLCGECKEKFLIKYANKFYDDFDKKFAKAKKIVGKMKFLK